MPWLTWIDDSALKKEVNKLLNHAKNAEMSSKQKFGKNIIDPFAALFEIFGFDISFETWYESESRRQAQKTLQNHIGGFHQNILGASNNRWINKHEGNIIDLVSEKDKALAEVKNKYNTISGGKLSDLYYSLDKLVSPKNSIYKNFTAYYVAIIPKRGIRYNRPFVPSDKDRGMRCPINEYIREIDGASFYSLVTGVENALEQLFDILPCVIADCCNDNIHLNHNENLKKYFISAYK